MKSFSHTLTETTPDYQQAHRENALTVDISDAVLMERGVIAGHGTPILSPEVTAERIAICRACEHHWYRDAENRTGLKCKYCNCALNARGKFLALNCPKKKWQAEG